MSSPKIEGNDHDQPLLNGHARASEDDIELTELGDEEDPEAGYLPHDESTKKRVSVIWIVSVLIITILGFTINTEATAYFEESLGWRKPYATFYITHSSLALPWVVHLCYLRWKDRHVPYKTWMLDYLAQLRESIGTVESFASSPSKLLGIKRKSSQGGHFTFLAITMAVVTGVLTVSGLSWFFALALTTPADLTAIYNCSTFFAAVFSVPILKERLGWISIVAVALSIGGTFTIAYGDTTTDHEESEIGAYRVIGNSIATVGAMAFGLYEVLFKKWASPSTPESQQSSLPLTLIASAFTGFFTFVLLWPPLIVLSVTQVEPFELPSLYECLWIVIAVLAGAVSITLLVVLVIWTDPVFGSMANVLTVFAVALGDWVVWGLSPSLPTYIGGALIFVAFGLLAKDTLGEQKH